MSPHPDSTAATTNRVVHLEDARMRARERVELVTEGITAITLLSAAQASYARNDLDSFVVLNAVAGCALVVAIVMGARNLLRGRAASTGVNVVGVFGGLAGVAEGLHRLHRAHFTYGQKHFALGVVTVLAGLLTAGVAFMMERREFGRALTISDKGMRMRLNKLRRFDVPWADIGAITVSSAEVRIARSGRRSAVVPLKRLVNRAEVSEAIVAAAAARGIRLDHI
ncbi:MAG: hypothetical protein M3Z30_02350 [Gemmatimonadota bacterium]|nr:hypothetical protein [Gemmatimonadota bacterium]